MQLMVLLLLAVGMLTVVSIPTVVFTYLGIDIFSRTPMLWLQSATQILTFAVPVLLMTLIYYRGRQREFCRLDFSGPKWLNALAAVVIVLLLVPAIDWITVWNDSWDLGRVGDYFRHLQEQTEGMLKQLVATDTVGGLLSNLLVVALLPGVCEELFFRAGIQNLLQRWFGGKQTPNSNLQTPNSLATHAAVWLTAVIFSLAHGEVFAFMPRLVLGLLLGYLYVGSGSLLVNMAAHFVNNALVVVVYWLVARGVLDIDPEEPLKVALELTVCCTAAALALFFITFPLFRRNTSTE